MTREEAIKILKAIRVYECYPKSASEETKEAIDMAIETLSAAEPKTGEWDLCKDDDGVYGVCSICGCYVDFSLYGRPYKVCPHCGARMTPYKGGEDE